MKRYKIISDRRTLVSKTPKRLRGRRDISVVVPTYNEEGNVIPLIGGITKALKGRYSFEVVIVDDASKDATQRLLTKRALKDGNVVAVMREGIRGIWSAQLDGVKICRGGVVVFMDADLSHPPSKIPELMSYIPEYDFVSASRYVSGGGMKGLPARHRVSTTLFNRGIKLLMGVPATDFTGVFHAIKKGKLMKILPKSNALAGEFDLDLLYYAKKKGIRFKEVPFTYVYRVAGKSKSRSMSSLAFIYGMRALKLRLFGRA
jgi:dolichol-phosphate mannosyltransferase